MAISIVTEEQIDAAAETLNPDNLEEVLERFGEAQPGILAFLISEAFDVLFPEERDYMLYLALVIWLSVDAVDGDLSIVTEDDIGKREEENWGIFEEKKAKSFRMKMDAFFEDTKQEDLLAFVEDALTVEEDNSEEEEVFSISKEGRTPMAVGLKTIIDVLSEI